MAERTFLIFLFIVVALFEALLFSVVQAGWSSYLYVLIDRGFYTRLCVEENSTAQSDSATYGRTSTPNFKSLPTCSKQQEQLNLLFTISQSIRQIFVISWGYLTYHYGIIKLKILSMALFIGGILLLGFASPGYEPIIVPGLVCMGVGGIAVLIFNMKITILLNSGTGIYVALLNGAADSSVITFRFVKLMYDYGIDYSYPFIGMAVIHFVVGSISLMFHKAFLSSQQIAAYDIQEATQLEGEEESQLKYSILNFITCSHLLWFTILITTMLTYIGTINKRLQDDFPGKVSFYTDMMAYIMLGGILSSFLMGGIIEWQKTLFIKSGRGPIETNSLQQVLHLFLSSILAVTLNALPLMTSEVTLYLEFTILTLFRAVLMSSNMTFVISMYPPKHTSVIFPIIMSVSGMVSSVQYGLFRWYGLSEGAHTHVWLFMTALAALSLIHPITVLMKGLGILESKARASIQQRDKSSYTTL